MALHSQEAFLLGRMGWTKDMALPVEEMASFRPKVPAVLALESCWPGHSVLFLAP